MMRMNRKLAPQIAARDNKRRVSTSLTVQLLLWTVQQPFFQQAESVAERRGAGNRYLALELVASVAIREKLHFSCTCFTG
jgi:hypothetical protein